MTLVAVVLTVTVVTVVDNGDDVPSGGGTRGDAGVHFRKCIVF